MEINRISAESFLLRKCTSREIYASLKTDHLSTCISTILRLGRYKWNRAPSVRRSAPYTPRPSTPCNVYLKSQEKLINYFKEFKMRLNTISFWMIMWKVVRKLSLFLRPTPTSLFIRFSIFVVFSCFTIWR